MLCQSTTGVRVCDLHDVQNCTVCRCATFTTSTTQQSGRVRSQQSDPIAVPGQGSTQHLYNSGLTISSPCRPRRRHRSLPLHLSSSRTCQTAQYSRGSAFDFQYTTDMCFAASPRRCLVMQAERAPCISISTSRTLICARQIRQLIGPTLVIFPLCLIIAHLSASSRQQRRCADAAATKMQVQVLPGYQSHGKGAGEGGLKSSIPNWLARTTALFSKPGHFF